MTDTTHLTWNDGMRFDVELGGHHFDVDAAPEHGGADAGPKPKALVLSALAGCTGMDVVSILKKMRMTWKTLEVDVSGELTEEHPKVYRHIQITYRFTGPDLDRDKIERAVDLSQTTYCGVTAMLRGTAEITHEIITEP